MNSTANSSPIPPTWRTAASACSSTRSNALPRWLCSRIPIPVPSRSQIASWARRRTSSGRTAGPDEKFRIRGTALPAGVFPVEHGDRDAVERLVRRLRDHHVGDLLARILGDPVRDLLAELL